MYKRQVLLSGITRSSFPNEIPALKACLKPKSFNLSQNMTVVFCPQNLNTTSIISDTIFLGSNLSTKENFILLFLGSKFANKNLPAVEVYFSNFLYPQLIEFCLMVLQGRLYQKIYLL